jgi:hypothetical protein
MSLSGFIYGGHVYFADLLLGRNMLKTPCNGQFAEILQVERSRAFGKIVPR